MKNSIVTLTILAASISAHAQTPHAIPYQAAARTSSGAVIASQPVGVRFTIRDSLATGTVLYSETHFPITSAQGLFTVQIGQGTPVSGSFSSINWGHNAKYLQVELDASGGTTYTDIGTQQLLSVPYALYAETAGGSNGWADSAGLMHNTNTTGRVGIGTSAPAARLHVADSSVVLTGGNVFNNTSVFGGTPSEDVKAPPINGLGDRIMWYADKAAFRVGNPGTGIVYPWSFLPDMESDIWSKNNIGYYSFAAGFGVAASGDYSCAIGGISGYPTAATGIGSMALAGGQASGNGSVAIGRNYGGGWGATGDGAISFLGATAAGPLSISMGSGSGGTIGAGGEGAIAIGNGGGMLSYAEADFSMCLNGGHSSGRGSIAIGSSDYIPSEAVGENSIAMLGGTANGNNSLAIGRGGYLSSSQANGEGSIAMLGGTANGTRSFAMQGGNANGSSSFAACGGYSAGENSFAVALGNASGQYSFAAAGGTATNTNSFCVSGGYAEGMYSFAALGGYAWGDGSLAVGMEAYANDNSSIAIGTGAHAWAERSLAIGSGFASGNHSTALGHKISTNEKAGAFAIGDWSGGVEYIVPTLENDADNQMVMRFAGGYKLYSDAGATVGVALDPSSNSWSVISDKRKKENFRPIDGNGILKKIGAMQLTSWNYKGQDPKTYRHYGPMAQDFYAAFGNDGVGIVGNDTTINQADMAGVTFAAVQALVSRDEQQQKEIDQLKRQNEELIKQNEALKATVKKYNDENTVLRAEVTNTNADLKNRMELLESMILVRKVAEIAK